MVQSDEQHGLVVLRNLRGIDDFRWNFEQVLGERLRSSRCAGFGRCHYQPRRAGDDPLAQDGRQLFAIEHAPQTKFGIEAHALCRNVDFERGGLAFAIKIDQARLRTAIGHDFHRHAQRIRRRSLRQHQRELRFAVAGERFCFCNVEYRAADAL